MPRVNLEEDVRPLSEFRANSATLMKRLRSTGRPLLLTQHGRGAAVLLDVSAYEDLMEELSVLKDIQAALEEERTGHIRSHSEARKSVLARLAK
ncbi:MAG: type II toxin-antitoxin system Phd/YefM family antitoxin [Candidatus Hydrogenedentes bacterium]|nr:type II toxin-antitoxin system Phd/YefM family antitoxin [Candidatus Hydrogenedentota bacterium]